MTFRALDAALNTVWAMETSALETLLTIAAREHDVNPQALEAYTAKTLANAEQATERDGVAIISANGALVKRANLFTAISGGTSYEIMRRDLQAAVDSGKKGAILNLDTPGGDASGVGELAAYVASLRGKFPVIAYVNGMAASAGYWLAAAAQEVVIDATAVLGSIGCQCAFRETAAKPGEKSYRFVSSQSPLKNAELDTEEGQKSIQDMVDAMAQVFVESVATYRDTSIETVLSDFGKGGIFVGQDAVNAGLADRIGNFESVLAELSATHRTVRIKGVSMADDSFTAAERDAAVASAKAAEKARVRGLTNIAAGFGVSAAALSAAIDGDVSVEAFSLTHAEAAAANRAAAAETAAAAVAAEAAKGKKVIASLQTDEEVAAAAAAAAVTEPKGALTAEELVSQILADSGIKKVN